MLVALSLIVFTDFITLHGAGGQAFFINPEQITSIREPMGNDRKRFPAGTRCVVSTTDGKFVPVREPCGEVHALTNRVR